ncbi:hypothetical protein [Salipiger sp. PrR003]|uniref:hypothetical protein n=1 Tax=Salipiger sp. PrR003 TaxID=2706776 RepID=UPI0013DB6269|nr:hypothetical protein [Salipiger sp. PrR003]NDV51519.1 hypothetical protein [Salipiger sp. PrR003]
MASAAYSLPRKTFDRDVLSGDPVNDPCKAAPDLEFIAEPDEIEGLDWHLVTLDILDMYNLFDIDDRLTLSGESDADAAARWASVRTWMGDMGGPEAALSSCPVIAKMNGADLRPLGSGFITSR